MDLTCQEQSSDSSYVETIWRSRSDAARPFISMAESRSGLVVTRYRGKTTITVRGPETVASPARNHAGAEFIGIRLAAGVFMPNLPPGTTMDRRDVPLPDASSHSFWLNGASWEFPDFDNVDTFIGRLVHDGVLIRDPAVAAVMQGQPLDMSGRTVQRRFLQATGMTHGTVVQIERARYALSLLKQGRSILETVAQAGYFDQPHLTRALKHYIGLTPAQVMDPGRTSQLSFLYKTANACDATLRLHAAG